MDKRYQVFISSTFEDLKEERQAVLRAILMLDHMPAGMELFPATDDAAWQLICDVIDASDYYVLVLGGRYGSLDEEGIGFTEKEHRYALSLGIPVVPFLHSNPDNLPRGKTETGPESWKKLQTFRKEVESKHTCMYWSTADELKAQVIVGMTATTKRHPRKGWIRAGGLASEEASRQILELQKVVAEQNALISRVSTSPPEGVENLSQGDDEIEIEFKVTFQLIGGAWDHPERIIRDRYKTRVTWNQLFEAFAPNLTEPQRETKVRSDIARYLRERHDREFGEKHPDYNPTSSTISETMFQTIRLQFTALGLISSEMRTVATDKEKEREARFCVLTPYGQAHLVKIGAIYRGKIT